MPQNNVSWHNALHVNIRNSLKHQHIAGDLQEKIAWLLSKNIPIIKKAQLHSNIRLKKDQQRTTY